MHGVELLHPQLLSVSNLQKHSPGPQQAEQHREGVTALGDKGQVAEMALGITWCPMAQHKPLTENIQSPSDLPDPSIKP